MDNCRAMKNIMSLCLLLVLAGCAVKQPAEFAEYDPWEGYNRGVFVLNDSLDQVIFKPVAKFYRTITPNPVKTGVRNFYSNLEDLPTAVNNILQGKIITAGSDLLRVVINTTFGIGGLFDVAGHFGLEKHEEDLGQTLAVWGVGAGPYFVIPLLGPSTVRDFPARLISYVINPLAYIDDNSTRQVLLAIDFVQQREYFLDQEQTVRKLPPDFYTSLRQYYLNRREFLISDGVMAATDFGDEEFE